MILSLDPSALVPLLVTEPTSPVCDELWDAADTVASTRLASVEATAALAAGERLRRISRRTRTVCSMASMSDSDDLALQDRYDSAMTVEIRQSDLRNDNAAVMRRVAEGESFVVTVNGRAVADVVPHRDDTRKRRFVPVAELADVFAADRVPDSAAWRADLAAADDTLGPDEVADPFTPRTT